MFKGGIVLFSHNLNQFNLKTIYHMLLITIPKGFVRSYVIHPIDFQAEMKAF